MADERTNPLGREAILGVALRGTGAAAALALAVLLAQQATPEFVGHYFVALAAFQLIQLATIGGCDAAILRALPSAGDNAARGGIWRAARRTAGRRGVVVVVLCYVVAAIIGQVGSARVAMYIAWMGTFALPAAIVNLVARWMLACEKTGMAFALEALVAPVVQLAIYVSLAGPLGPEISVLVAFAIGWMVAWLLASRILVLDLPRKYRVAWDGLEPVSISSLDRNMLASNIAQHLGSSVDIWLLGLLSGPVAVAQLGIAVRLTRPGKLLANTVGLTLARDFAGEHGRDHGHALQQAIRLAAMGLVAIALSAGLGRRVMAAIGPSYAAAYIPLVLLTVALTLQMAAAPFVIRLKMQGGEGRVRGAFLLGLGVQLITLAPLAIYWGATGAAVARLMAISVIFGVVSLRAERRLRREMRSCESGGEERLTCSTGAVRRTRRLP